MVANELSEWQFKILKEMCKQRVYVVFGPHNLSGDTDEVRNGYIKNLTQLHDLVKQGFMVNVTSDFTNVLNDARAKRQRTFDAFAVTPMGVQMFEPPEGLIH